MTYDADSRPASRRGGKISLVVPVYNEGPGLYALRDSITAVMDATA